MRNDIFGKWHALQKQNATRDFFPVTNAERGSSEHSESRKRHNTTENIFQLLFFLSPGFKQCHFALTNRALVEWIVLHIMKSDICSNEEIPSVELLCKELHTSQWITLSFWISIKWHLLVDKHSSLQSLAFFKHLQETYLSYEFFLFIFLCRLHSEEF